MHAPCPPPFFLFDFHDANGRPLRLCFTNPVDTIIAHHTDEVRDSLRAVQRAVEAGFYAAGYITYEAAPAFDPALSVHGCSNIPLLQFGIFREPRGNSIHYTHRADSSPYSVSPWQPMITKAEYDKRIAIVREAIASGETYQVNFTMRLRAQFAGDDLAYYHRLCAAQGGAYCAYLDFGRYRILSASPELFFRWSQDQIVTRPMKGTNVRGRWLEEDLTRAAWLRASEKNRAENVMIVDLLRNDLGRVADFGSVSVPHLFDVERYRTIFQMTSTVVAKTSPHVRLEDILASLFPCGSVTGAPKVSTMQLIAALEDLPRQVYCGTIGYITPLREAIFNVAIRTVLLDTHTGLAEYGVGGGITWDSIAEDEYEEAMLKSAVLDEEWPSFDLLETIRLDNGTYYLKERHIQRLLSSARYFDVCVSEDAVRADLDAHAHKHPCGTRRARLLVSREGKIYVESSPLEQLLPSTFPLPVALAGAPISRNNRFLFHKTTYRNVYDTHRNAHPDVFDVLLWNEEGEPTEFTSGNLVVELDGQRWTPCCGSGLLAGTFRQELLAAGEIKERAITRADLHFASNVWLINSVRCWVPVTIVW